MDGSAGPLVKLEGRTFKNGKPVARLTPEAEKRCTGRDLAEILGKTELSPPEARSWQRDLRAAGKTLKTPSDKWQ